MTTTIYELELLESGIDQGVDPGGLLSVEEAERRYQFLRELSGVSALQFVVCGDAFRSLDILEKAIEAYGDGIRRDPGCVSAYVNRGEVYFELAVAGIGEAEVLRYGSSAVDDFKVAVRLSPESGDLVWRLGAGLLVIGDVVGARVLAEQLLLRSNDSSTKRDFLYLIGFAKLFGNDPEGALVVFDDMLNVEGGNSDGRFGRFAVSLIVNDTIGAESLLASFRGDDLALWEAGKTLQKSGCRSYLDVARSLAGFQSGRANLQ